MLHLGFATRAGRVLVQTNPDFSLPFQTLRSRFVSATSINPVAFDLELDDLLVNLYEFASWPPEDTDVRWQPELLQMVEANHADSSVLSQRLAKDDDNITHQDLGSIEGWDAPLTDFQRRDVCKLLELAHGANFSVPGAGKTRATLAVYQARMVRGEVSRMLVVCPKSAFESWESEALICYPDSGLSVAIMDGPVPPIADVVLINYERLPDAREALLSWLRGKPTLLVLDEAHRMKRGPTGAWGATCLALAPYAQRRLILTGTPAPNGARDLENLFAFVWPGQGRARVRAALRDRDMRQASQLLRPLFVRTTKSELSLPPVDLAVRRITLPPLHREIYDALLGQVAGRWRGGQDQAEALGRVTLYLIMAATTPALLATGASPHEPLPYRVQALEPNPDSELAELMRDLPQFELSPKYQEVAAIVAANASQGRKTLVWSTFVRNLRSLEHLLNGFNPALVHGGSDDREGELRRFREDPDCMVLLSNPATLGEGVSLHHVCHDAVYVDRDFAAGRFLQSLDRIHRLGLAPDSRTTITVLVADETIDEVVEQRLRIKLDFMGSVLDDPAVLQLADLDEEPSVGASINLEDMLAIGSYLDASAAT